MPIFTAVVSNDRGADRFLGVLNPGIGICEEAGKAFQLHPGAPAFGPFAVLERRIRSVRFRIGDEGHGRVGV